MGQRLALAHQMTEGREHVEYKAEASRGSVRRHLAARELDAFSPARQALAREREHAGRKIVAFHHPAPAQQSREVASRAARGLERRLDPAAVPLRQMRQE